MHHNLLMSNGQLKENCTLGINNCCFWCDVKMSWAVGLFLISHMQGGVFLIDKICKTRRIFPDIRFNKVDWLVRWVSYVLSSCDEANWATLDRESIQRYDLGNTITRMICCTSGEFLYVFPPNVRSLSSWIPVLCPPVSVLWLSTYWMPELAWRSLSPGGGWFR